MSERFQIEFPCTFPIKAIGRDTDGFEAVVTEIVRRHVPNLTDDAITRRPSARSNYLAVTANIVADSQEQLDALYRELSAHKQVLFLL
jgi:putative lipoic acid-binding regulatory protein